MAVDIIILGAVLAYCGFIIYKQMKNRKNPGAGCGGCSGCCGSCRGCSSSKVSEGVKHYG